MIRTITFKKESDTRWYAEISEWKGTKDELEMVMGADDMLNMLSDGEDTVSLAFSTEIINTNITLDFLREEFNGAWYKFTHEIGVTYDIWLCSVTKFVFNEYPTKIYFK